MSTFLIVPGAWHGSGHWSEVVEVLVASGHRALAVDLPGSGRFARFPQSIQRRELKRIMTEPSVVSDIGLDDYQRVLLPLLEDIAETAPVTLIGHSFGGVSATLLAEQRPDLIERLIYVTAHVPVSPSGSSCAELDGLPENAASETAFALAGDPSRLGVARIDTRSTDPTYLSRLRTAFCEDAPPERFEAWVAQLAPDLPRKALEGSISVSPEHWGSIPRTYIRCTADRAIPLALQDRMIHDADRRYPTNTFSVRTLESGHSPFLSVPQALAAQLLTAGHRPGPAVNQQ